MKTKKCKYCKHSFDYITIENNLECPYCLSLLKVKPNPEDFEILAPVAVGDNNGTEL